MPRWAELFGLHPDTLASRLKSGWTLEKALTTSTMPKLVSPIFAEYRLACTHPGCFGKVILEQAESAGWKLGQVISEDLSYPSLGRCPVCKRHKMKVVKAPEPPKPTGLKGWTKVPTA